MSKLVSFDNIIIFARNKDEQCGNISGIMNRKQHIRHSLPLLLAAVVLAGCQRLPSPDAIMRQAKLFFDISVTREGEPIPESRIAPRVTPSTKGEMVDATELLGTMDTRKPFSLIGIEEHTGSILLDNVPVSSTAEGRYALNLDGSLLDIPSQVLLSAYYPHVKEINYQQANQAYSIPFAAAETEAGPLVSKTVERNIAELNTLPLEFGHITNDIGFKICDITPAKELQGHIHLRKLTAYNVASAGVFVNDILHSRGNWDFQGYYRSVTVFEGDAPVGVGSAQERFVGRDALVERMAESNRFYAIPDDIIMGRQYVEAVFDIEGFTHAGEYYSPLPGQVRKYLIYGLLPGNVMTPGKQYTFHIGLDLSAFYREISFSAEVNEWETKIYENNEDF